MAPPNLPAKVCATCGRSFSWRKKWARSWAEVAHCSDRCRSRRTRAEPLELESRILALLARQGRGASVAVSDVLSEQEQQDGMRMAAVLAAARRLAHGATIDILERGVVVDPDRARGPLRVRLR
ncbi:hypothetical protein BH11MYX1_BH11MYX1_41460 [soil metagenome]